jgi:hypothetical protein
MRNSPWNRWLRPKPEVTGRPRGRAGRGTFVPRLEVLEDRCLLNAVPTITFAPDTNWQPVAGVSGTVTPGSAQITSTDNLTSLSVAINYSQGQIQLQYAVTGNVNVVIAGTLVPANGGDTSLQDPAMNFSLSLSLIGSRAGFTTATNFPIAIQAADTNDAVSVIIMISGVGASGTPTASPTADIHILNQNDFTAKFYNSATTMPISAQAPDIVIQSFSGIPNFSITFARPTLTNTLTVTSGSSWTQDSNGYTVFVASADRAVLDRPKLLYGIFNPPEKGLSSERRPISTYNSLVLAEPGAGFHLTLSITQEISQRSSSPAAQTTWTGLRPPLEAPLCGPESPATKIGLSFDKKDTNGSSPVGVRDRNDADNRPMEIMVANILTALQQARAEDRARDIAQAAVRKSTPIDPDIERRDSQSVAFWPWEEGGERDTRIVLPLNELLDGIAPAVTSGEWLVTSGEEDDFSSVATGHWPPATGSAPEQNRVVLTHPLPSGMKTTSRLRWLPFAETLVAVFAALGWPGVNWLGQLHFLNPHRRAKNSED